MKRDTVRLIVRSKKIPIRVENVTIPYPNPRGAALPISKRIVIYDYVLDEEQQTALADVRALARQSGLSLEIRDLARETLIGKISRKLGGVADRTPLLILGRESNAFLKMFLGTAKSSGTGRVAGQ